MEHVCKVAKCRARDSATVIMTIHQKSDGNLSAVGDGNLARDDSNY